MRLRWHQLAGGCAVPLINHIVDLAAGLIGKARNMRNFFEKRDDYMYTEFADDFMDLDGVIGWVKEFLSHPQFTHSMPILWNALPITKTNLSFGDMQTFGDFILSIRERRGSGRSAFVCDEDLVFGLFRTHEMLNNEKYDYDYHVFRSLEVAHQWVTGGEI